MLIAKLCVSELFKRNAVPSLVLTDLHRDSTIAVSGGDEAAGIRKDQNIHSTLYHFLGIADTVSKTVLVIYQRCQQLRGIHSAAGHSIEVATAVGQTQLDQLFGIVDHTNSRDGIGTQAGPYEHRLRIRIADTADHGSSLHLAENMLKFRPERCIFNAVDLSLQADFFIVGSHTAPTGAEVRMVVHTEKHIHHTIVFGCDSKKSSHWNLLYNWSIRQKTACSGS